MPIFDINKGKLVDSRSGKSRVEELTEQFIKKDIYAGLKDYHQLIDALLYLNQAIVEAGIKFQDWERYSETLLLKFALPGLTLHETLSGLELKSKYFKDLSGVRLVDLSSIKTILRSQFETFLMYRHIYVHPKSDDEKKLRHYTWIYSSLLQRQSFPTGSESSQRQKQNDQEALLKLKVIIQGLESFKLLSTKQQTSLFKTGTSKLFKNWSTIIEEVRFSDVYNFPVMYNYLSMYTHSEGLSALQLKDSGMDYKTNIPLIYLDLDIARTLTCGMIKSLVENYKCIEIRYHTLPIFLQYDINFYYNKAFIR